jgi:hypothetical protein
MYLLPNPTLALARKLGRRSRHRSQRLSCKASLSYCVERRRLRVWARPQVLKSQALYWPSFADIRPGRPKLARRREPYRWPPGRSRNLTNLHRWRRRSPLGAEHQTLVTVTVVLGLGFGLAKRAAALVKVEHLAVGLAPAAIAFGPVRFRPWPPAWAVSANFIGPGDGVLVREACCRYWLPQTGLSKDQAFPACIVAFVHAPLTTWRCQRCRECRSGTGCGVQ